MSAITTDDRGGRAGPRRCRRAISRPRIAGVLLAGVVLSGLTTVASGHTARPQSSANPQPPVIVYVRDADIWSTATGQDAPTNLTNTQDIFERDPTWSPGQDRIAFIRERSDQNVREIWVMRADGADSHPVPNGPREAHLFHPSWSPDGTRIAFARRNGISVMNTNGTGLHEVVGQSGYRMLQPEWSPDGKSLVYQREPSGASSSRGEIWVKEDGRAPRRLAAAGRLGYFIDPVWSPSGDEIAFGGRPDGALGGIMIMNADGTSAPRQITNNTVHSLDMELAWSPAGGQILFNRHARSDSIYAVDARDGSHEQLIVEGSAPAVLGIPARVVADLSPIERAGYGDRGDTRGVVNLRSGPSTSAPVFPDGPLEGSDDVGDIAGGERVTIVCTARGEPRRGSLSEEPTNVWDKLLNGHWITDAQVDTGTDKAVLPTCPPGSETPEAGLDDFVYDHWVTAFAYCDEKPATQGIPRFVDWMNGRQWPEGALRDAPPFGTGRGSCRRDPETGELVNGVHNEGRALDWGLDRNVDAQNQAAYAVIHELLADDAALARRMGIQEIIYDDKAWDMQHGNRDHLDFTIDYDRIPGNACERLYNPGDDGWTTAHCDHVHFAMNHKGANLLTSFWR